MRVRISTLSLGAALLVCLSRSGPCPGAADAPAKTGTGTPYRLIRGIPKDIEQIQGALARVEEEYETAVKSKKERGEKSSTAKVSEEMRAVAAAELHRFYKEAFYYLRAPQYDKQGALKDRIGKRSAEMKEAFETAGKNGALVLYLPSVDHWTSWHALPENGIVSHVERIGGKPFADIEKPLLEWLNTGRWAPHRHSSMKEYPVWTYKANEKGAFELNDDIGKEMIYWFYIRSPKAQSARLSIALSKGDEVKSVYANLVKQKHKPGKPVTLELRQGTNHVLVQAANTKDNAFEISFHLMDGKDLEIAQVP